MKEGICLETGSEVALCLLRKTDLCAVFLISTMYKPTDLELFLEKRLETQVTFDLRH
jgi:hypothetical protein